MSRNLVRRKTFNLPEEWKIFFKPPLIGNEKYEDYMVLFNATAMAFQPTNIIQWLNVKEYADNSWELQRERGIKGEIIMLNREKARSSSGLAESLANHLQQKALEKNPSAFTKKALQPKGGDDHTKSSLAEAYVLGHDAIDKIDTRIASYMFRRDAALRHNERHTASQERGASPIIDGEFSEPEED